MLDMYNFYVPKYVTQVSTLLTELDTLKLINTIYE